MLFPSKNSQEHTQPRILKFGMHIVYDKLHCVYMIQPPFYSLDLSFFFPFIGLSVRLSVSPPGQHSWRDILLPSPSALGSVSTDI